MTKLTPETRTEKVERIVSRIIHDVETPDGRIRIIGNVSPYKLAELLVEMEEGDV